MTESSRRSYILHLRTQLAALTQAISREARQHNAAAVEALRREQKLLQDRLAALESAATA